MREDLNRVLINKNICHGKPHIKGTRIMVEQVLDLLAAGASANEIIKEDFPDITMDDIKACLIFANKLVRNENIIIYESGLVEAS